MLTITNQQFAAFDKYYADKFKREIKTYFKERYKGNIPNIAAFEAFIDLKMLEANKYGFEEDADVIEYIDYCIRFADLQTDPLSIEVIEILTYPDRLPKRKLVVLSEFFNIKK